MIGEYINTTSYEQSEIILTCPNSTYPNLFEFSQPTLNSFVSNSNILDSEAISAGSLSSISTSFQKPLDKSISKPESMFQESKHNNISPAASSNFISVKEDTSRQSSHRKLIHGISIRGRKSQTLTATTNIHSHCNNKTWICPEQNW